jgi:uncharacterized membrane protein
VSRWYCQPILNSYLLVAGVAAVLCLLLLIRPTFRRLSRWRHGLLAALRLMVIALLVLGMLRPTHVSTSSKPQTATLLLLFDQTRSMQLPQAAGDKTRWAAEREALGSAEPALSELASKLEVKVYGYDASLHPVESSRGKWTLPETADGEQTDIGSSLFDAVQRELGKRLAGVILLGDGAQTAFNPQTEVQEAGRELARLGCPLYAVPFGPPGDSAQSRDVAVENLQDQYTVFVKNELPIQVALRVRGYVHKAIPVELVVENAAGQRETVKTLEATAREDDAQLPLEFSYVPQQPGRYKLTVRAAEQPGELVTKNNQLSAFLRVLEGGLRVLYLEGELRYEQKFLRRSLDASQDMEVEFLWVDHRRREDSAAERTKQLNDKFAGGQYDAILLGDLDSAALGDENLKSLAKAVEQGKGLALLGGYHSFGPGGYGESPLADLLPIRIDRLERQDFDQPLRRDLHLEGPLHMLPVRAHPIVSLAPEKDNLAAWKRLPPLTGANRFVGVKDAVGTRVLAETENGQPLLVTGQYGRGRVLAFAGDSTWRWWMQGFDAEHRRFWRQVVLWLVRRDELNQDDVWIKLAQRRFNPGARVTFTAGANTASGEPIAEATLQAELLGPGGKRAEVPLTRDGEQWSGIVHEIQEPGDYAIEIRATGPAKPIGTVRGEFLVFDRDIELSNPAADHDQLARLASQTREYGGRVVAPEQLPALLEEIRDRPPDLQIEVQTKWQLADTATDAWSFFLLVLALLAGEWTLRKRWGLV